jgi:hypothetical protein
MPNLKSYLRIFMKEIRNTMENLSELSKFPDQELYLGPLNAKQECYLLDHDVHF